MHEDGAAPQCGAPVRSHRHGHQAPPRPGAGGRRGHVRLHNEARGRPRRGGEASPTPEGDGKGQRSSPSWLLFLSLFKVAKCYFAQIVHAISYCHQLHVVHRDLKPENVVFFEKQGVVKLTDFGFSNRFQPGKTLNTSCGSLAYSAPEILLGDEYDAPAVGECGSGEARRDAWVGARPREGGDGSG